MAAAGGKQAELLKDILPSDIERMGVEYASSIDDRKQYLHRTDISFVTGHSLSSLWQNVIR